MILRKTSEGWTLDELPYTGSFFECDMSILRTCIRGVPHGRVTYLKDGLYNIKAGTTIYHHQGKGVFGHKKLIYKYWKHILTSNDQKRRSGISYQSKQ